MAELLPCPFCGGEAKIFVVKKGYKSIIMCTTHYCGFMRHSFNNGDTDENAALRLTVAWNRRTQYECERIYPLPRSKGKEGEGE